MSNRIDLTQFKRVFDGGHPKHLFEKVERRFKDGGVRTTPLYLGPQDVDAITLLPELIAELKRCYELIDAQKENLEFLNGAIEKLHEETWTEAVVELVEEHHPSEWCDYSHCWKCEEEPTSE